MQLLAVVLHSLSAGQSFKRLNIIQCTTFKWLQSSISRYTSRNCPAQPVRVCESKIARGTRATHSTNRSLLVCIQLTSIADYFNEAAGVNPKRV